MLRARNPESTRSTLLNAALACVHRKGFQATSLADILQDTALTKGALYHHFPNKQALGYALVEELIRDYMHALWIEPLACCENPIDALVHALRQSYRELAPELIELGCPLNNLAQEMSPIDEGFRQRINAVYHDWAKGIAKALRRGQRSGNVRRDIDPRATAAFVIASIEGCLGMAKNAQSAELLGQCGAGLIGYLDTLRDTREGES